jgi:pyruvate dehydrogenase E1 component alpha subunit
VDDIADLAKGYGMPGIVVDGQDVLAVAEVVGAAVEQAREGKGPTLVECKTSRFCAHFVSAPDMCGCEVRSQDEVAKQKERDPILVCQKKLMARRALTKKEIQRIEDEIEAEVEAAEVFADDSPLPEPTRFDEMLYAN